MSCFGESDSCLRREKYIVLGDPIPLARPRFSKGHVFDSQKLKKLNISSMIMHQHGCKKKFTGAVHLEVIFFMGIPSSISKKKKEQIEGSPHKCRPDFSNLLKFIEDVAQDILYDDDCIIASVCGSKVYSTQPRTEMIVTELGG